jgi:hypothetical protein
MMPARRGHGVDMPGHPVSSGSWARKIRIASALTKPVITERETKRISAPSAAARDDLQHAGQHGGRQQVLQAVLLDQRDHQQRHRAGGRRDHARPAAGEGDDHGDAERGVQPDLGVDAGDDREGDGLGISASATTRPASRSPRTLGHASVRGGVRGVRATGLGRLPVAHRPGAIALRRTGNCRRPHRRECAPAHPADSRRPIPPRVARVRPGKAASGGLQHRQMLSENPRSHVVRLSGNLTHRLD